nr:translation initiation factor IF-2-like [Pongo pygmaeus]
MAEKRKDARSRSGLCRLLQTPIPSRTRDTARHVAPGPPRPARAQPSPCAASPRAPSARKPEKGRSRARRPGTAKKARGRADGRSGGGQRRREKPAAPPTPAASSATPSAPGPGEKKEPLRGGATTHQGKGRAERETRRLRRQRLEPRAHAPAVGEHTARVGGTGDSSAGLTTFPGSSRGGFSSREEPRGERRQPSLQRSTRRPLLIARAATRVTRRASRRARSPAPGMTQPSSARRAQPGEPDGGAHWPGPRRRPRPQRGAGPRGEGQPPPCGHALESLHPLAPPADYRQRSRGTSPSP